VFSALAKIVRPRLSTLVATLFMVYSLAILGFSYDSWRGQVEDEQQYLLEDAGRRVREIVNNVQVFREETALQADIYEIRAYLQNRDLGMSMRYGLSASLLAIERRFKEHLSEEPTGSEYERMVYFGSDGAVLVDTAPDEPLPDALLRRLNASGEDLLIDPVQELILVRAPVGHKGKPGGTVVSLRSLAHLQQFLIDSDVKPWREVLISAGGEQLVSGGKQRIPRELLGALADMPPGKVIEVEGGLAGWAGQKRMLLVKTPVPLQGLQMIKFVPPELVHGHMPSLPVVIGAAVFPILMLIGAVHLDRARNNSELLEMGIALANQQRGLVERQNRELSAEMVRREEVERALTVSEERWALAASGANDGIWDWNPVTGETFYSERWKDLLGYRAEEIEGHILEKENRIHPEDKPTVDIELYRHLRGCSEHYQCEYRMRRKGGEYIWVLDRGRVLFDEVGKPVRVTGSMSDISERRAAQRLVDERNVQLRTILGNSPDGVVSFGEDYRVLLVNPAFVRMTHLEPASVTGLTESGFTERLRAICTEQSRFRALAEMRAGAASKDGRELIELTVAGKPTLEVKVVESNSEKVPTILFFHDVTHETEVNRMKSEFLSTAAHELRTPMASVYGYAELLLQPDFDEPMRREFAQTIFKQSELMSSIINELLDLARIEARRGKDFVIERLNLSRFLDEAIAGYKPPNGRDTPVLKRNGTDPWIRADRKKLQQTVNNVLSNAYKYSPDGGPVEVEVVAGQGRSGICVRDQGIGMSPEQLERVFERFYRADTSGAIPGTGLGMSIVKEIVELLGGEVAMDSTEGVGSTVSLWVPEAEDAA
jgi:PAS domain S-box-containing protein